MQAKLCIRYNNYYMFYFTTNLRQSKSMSHHRVGESRNMKIYFMMGIVLEIT